MSRFVSRALSLSQILALATLMILCDHPASAQESDTYKIVTADGVRLHATFYPSAKKASPTVIMLHPIGEGKSSKPQDWKNLAEALQKANYSVVTFDFRGHGDSTTIEDKDNFWKKPQNLANVRSKDKETIDVKDYIKSGSTYLPVLVNDIAAVRAWLERRNDDSKDCNTSSLIVIGADNGATLGALWMNSEWHRYRYNPPANVFVFAPKFLENRPEGKDIIGAVFLSVQPTLDKRTVSVSGLLKVACKDNATAAAFFVGKGDSKGHKLAKAIETSVKVKSSKKHDYIGAVELETDLTGMKLLQKSLGTNKLIVQYLDNVIEDRKNDRIDREFTASYFMWKTPAGQFIQAKNKKGEKNLNFDDYNKFISQ